MSRLGIRRRLDAMERVFTLESDEVTLEQLLRSIWQQNRASYMQLVAEHACGANLLLPTLQREEDLGKQAGGDSRKSTKRR